MIKTCVYYINTNLCFVIHQEKSRNIILNVFLYPNFICVSSLCNID